MAYNDFMEIIESHIFEKQANDEFALFQGFLFSNPKAGVALHVKPDKMPELERETFTA